LKRLVIFIDYQNVYKTAQNIFDIQSAKNSKHIDITKISKIILEKLPQELNLNEIRVYSGVPSRAVQPKEYWSSIKRFDKWRKDPKVTLHVRTLTYSKKINKTGKLSPKEKGIDVLLAVDLVSMAYEKEYDAALIFSLDSDLKPAPELIRKIPNKTDLFVAAWRKKGVDPRRLSLRINTPYCIWLNENDFNHSLLN
jgi:uncharacterized LabA/DUF88 family protein